MSSCSYFRAKRVYFKILYRICNKAGTVQCSLVVISVLPVFYLCLWKCSLKISEENLGAIHQYLYSLRPSTDKPLAARYDRKNKSTSLCKTTSVLAFSNFVCGWLPVCGGRQINVWAFALRWVCVCSAMSGSSRFFFVFCFPSLWVLLWFSLEAFRCSLILISV